LWQVWLFAAVKPTDKVEFVAMFPDVRGTRAGTTANITNHRQLLQHPLLVAITLFHKDRNFAVILPHTS
jgi:hypothetical protein